MASLRDRISDVLNEMRTLILGAQILLGFQFQAVFQTRFASLPGLAQRLDLVALALMLVAAGLLIAPTPFHSLVERGDDTLRMHRYANRMAVAAPLPFALCMGIDVYFVAAAPLGQRSGAVAGVAILLIGLFAWYGIEAMDRGLPPEHQTERQPPSTEERIRTLGTEMRVILPGAQALLGFQFVAILSDRFEQLPNEAKAIHLASLLCIAIAIILLMAFAPYHRIVAHGEDRPEVVRFGGRVMLAALLPLALGLAGDSYIVTGAVIGWSGVSIVVPAAALVFLLGIWFGYPLLMRRAALR